MSDSDDAARSEPRDPNVFDQELTLREPSRALTIASTIMIGLGALFVGVVAVAAMMHSLGKDGGPGPLGFDLLVAGGLLRLARNSWRTAKRRATVRADTAGVHIDGKLALPRGEIVQGTFQPGGSKSRSVVLRGKRHALRFQAEVADEEEALRMLHALGLDAASKRADFRIAGSALPMRTRSLLLAGMASIGFVLTGALHSPVPLLIAGLAIMATVTGTMWPGHLVVGADGILVKQRFRERFIPMADIKSADAVADNALTVSLASGEHVRIVTGQARSDRSNAFARAQRDEIIARIDEALQVHRSQTSVDVAALVRRGERTGEEWFAELKKLRARAAGYRDLVLRDEDLWQLVEDPRAAEDARAGAALVLRPKLDDAGKNRIRVAADAAASPKLRIALEAATSDDADEAEIERALSLDGTPSRP
jgi:hypothetical protein